MNKIIDYIIFYILKVISLFDRRIDYDRIEIIKDDRHIIFGFPINRFFCSRQCWKMYSYIPEKIMPNKRSGIIYLFHIYEEQLFDTDKQIEQGLTNGETFY